MHTPNKNHRWRRKIMRFGLWNVIYRFWMQMHAEGLHNVPARGPTVMMVNHIHVIDPAIMISFAPHGRDIVPLAKTEAFELPWQRLFVGQWGAIPVQRGQGDRSALKAAISHINEGDIVLLFAEGTRNREGLQQGEEGSVFLALKTNAVVVPVGLWGTRGFPYSLWRDFRTTPVHVSFGRPFRIREIADRSSRHEVMSQITDEAMYRIAGLLPAKWRGIYSDISRATTEHIEFVDLAREGLQ